MSAVAIGADRAHSQCLGLIRRQMLVQRSLLPHDIVQSFDLDTPAQFPVRLLQPLELGWRENRGVRLAAILDQHRVDFLSSDLHNRTESILGFRCAYSPYSHQVLHSQQYRQSCC